MTSQVRDALCSSARRATDVRFLVHVTCGEENPTRAALGLLVAKSAVDEGHAVDVFLAGDGAGLARSSAATGANGLGTGNAGEWLTYLAGHGVTIYVSGMSAQARGLDADSLKAAGFVPSPPTKLVALAAEADRVLVY